MSAVPLGEDRFANWPRLWARAALLVFAAAVLASALVPVNSAPQLLSVPGAGTGQGGGTASQQSAKPARDADLALYDTVIARIARGDNYYVAATEEHRRQDYPVRPGVAVRLPTLAYLEMLLGDRGQGAGVVVPGELAAMLALLLALVMAWWRRLGEEPGGQRIQLIGTALVFTGASLGLNHKYYVLHELWAGILLALALGLHRPGRKWVGALAAAALALAIREQSLPFVLLMAAMAGWRRDWKECAAWSALIALFCAGLAVHLHFVDQQVLPADRMAPGWLALRGLPGWLSNVVLSSNLRFLPHFLAGPLVMLMVLGWAGWKSPLGTFAALLYLGYGAAFMIAGRADNFYWGAMIVPAMFVGLALAPMALRSLWRRSF